MLIWEVSSLNCPKFITDIHFIHLYGKAFCEFMGGLSPNIEGWWINKEQDKQGGNVFVGGDLPYRKSVYTYL